MARIVRINNQEELEVFQLAFKLAMRVFEVSKTFPREEMYSLTDQIRRASRSVCANVGEAWRKRRYSAAFVSKLSDAETEATETQVWIRFAVSCEYLAPGVVDELRHGYDNVIGKLVNMINRPGEWVLRTRER